MGGTRFVVRDGFATSVQQYRTAASAAVEGKDVAQLRCRAPGQQVLVDLQHLAAADTVADLDPAADEGRELAPDFRQARLERRAAPILRRFSACAGAKNSFGVGPGSAFGRPPRWSQWAAPTRQL